MLNGLYNIHSWKECRSSPIILSNFRSKAKKRPDQQVYVPKSRRSQESSSSLTPLGSRCSSRENLHRDNGRRQKTPTRQSNSRCTSPSVLRDKINNISSKSSVKTHDDVVDRRVYHNYDKRKRRDSGDARWGSPNRGKHHFWESEKGKSVDRDLDKNWRNPSDDNWRSIEDSNSKSKCPKNVPAVAVSFDKKLQDSKSDIKNDDIPCSEHDDRTSGGTENKVKNDKSKSSSNGETKEPVINISDKNNSSEIGKDKVTKDTNDVLIISKVESPKRDVPVQQIEKPPDPPPVKEKPQPQPLVFSSWAEEMEEDNWDVLYTDSGEINSKLMKEVSIDILV